MKDRPIDILGLGVTTVDDFLYVAGYPPPDVKTRVVRRDRQCGGLTMTALVAAARLGARCSYAGVLGDDELSQMVVDCMQREDIDTGLLVRRPGARPVHATIVVDLQTQTRNIFYDPAGAVGADVAWPPASVVCSAKVLFVDTYGIEGMTRAARIAREHGIPVVADFEHGEAPGFGELLHLVDHLIVSRGFACSWTESPDPEVAASRLWHDGRDTVVVTDGDRGGWYVTRASGLMPRHYPAFEVNTVDTTGCGDVFHGAYAAALARGLCLEERLRLATAAAALKASKPGGQAGAPTLAEVEAFVSDTLAGRPVFSLDAHHVTS